jgi:4-hydroxy-tetrahydrodipicolinate reductase
MNIALIGYGKMGRMIESAALERHHRIVALVDPFADPPPLSQVPLYRSVESAEALSQADVAIEFTGPKTALTNILGLVQKGVPTVVGSTGWTAQLDTAVAAVTHAGASLLWSSNFSLGVQIFYRLTAYAARMIDPFAEYDVGGWEAHHNKKADSPSGTAKELVSRVLHEMNRKTTAVYETLNRPPEVTELHYPSLRVGAMPGTHSLFFDSTADTIEITHTARSREGFARGAVRAAEWLVQCPGAGATAGKARGGVFTMDDVLRDLLPPESP